VCHLYPYKYVKLLAVITDCMVVYYSIQSHNLDGSKCQ